MGTSGGPTPEQLLAGATGATRFDTYWRRVTEIALLLLIAFIVAVSTWTMIRLDGRGERLNDAVATRAACVCPGTPAPP